MAKLLVEASRVARQHSSVYSVFPNTHKCFPILLTYFIYTNSSQSTTVFYTLVHFALRVSFLRCIVAAATPAAVYACTGCPYCAPASIIMHYLCNVITSNL